MHRLDLSYARQFHGRSTVALALVVLIALVESPTVVLVPRASGCCCSSLPLLALVLVQVGVFVAAVGAAATTRGGLPSTAAIGHVIGAEAYSLCSTSTHVGE